MEIYDIILYLTFWNFAIWHWAFENLTFWHWLPIFCIESLNSHIDHALTCIQGSHPTWTTWNFVIFFSRPGKCLEFGQKVVKTWNFNSKPEISKFYVSSFTFEDVIYKYNSDLLLFHTYIINTNTDSKPKWPWISLLLPGNNLENTWHFVSQEKLGTLHLF